MKQWMNTKARVQGFSLLGATEGVPKGDVILSKVKNLITIRGRSFVGTQDDM